MNKAGIGLYLVLAAGLSLLASGCRNRTVSPPPDLSGVSIETVRIHDYASALFRLDADRLSSELDKIYPEFAFFLGDNYKDTLNLIRLHEFLEDPLIRELWLRYQSNYSELSSYEAQFTEALRLMKHYFPDAAIPEIFTYLSGLYYEYPIQDYDSALVIALDLYLGADEEAYRAVGIPQYQVRRMTPLDVLPDAFREMSVRFIGGEPAGRTLLDKMLWYGKMLYFLDLVLPGTADSLKIGYSAEKLDWCREHEAETWAFLIERDLLYSTDSHSIDKLVQDGPFTSGLPPESPGRIGWWTGWQIVRAYAARHPGLSPAEIFGIAESQKFLAASGYKPRR